jgi:ketosteroid isomerase-like protein
MKKTICVFSIAVLLIAACQTKAKIVPVNTEAEKASISALLDKYNSAFKAKDLNSILTTLSSDVLVCGTDPSEFWDKKQIIDMWTQAFADTSLKLNFSIDRREIRLVADGNSALVVDQYVMSFLSPKIPIRSVYHLVKVDEKWMLDYISWNLIPKNEDIPKLNKALE